MEIKFEVNGSKISLNKTQQGNLTFWTFRELVDGGKGLRLLGGCISRDGGLIRYEKVGEVLQAFDGWREAAAFLLDRRPVKGSGVR